MARTSRRSLEMLGIRRARRADRDSTATAASPLADSTLFRRGASGTLLLPGKHVMPSQAAVAEAIKGARAVIVTGKLGPHLLRLAAAAGVEHIVLPSLAGETAANQSLGPLGRIACMLSSLQSQMLTCLGERSQK